MGKINFANVKTANQKRAVELQARLKQIKSEVEKRIVSIIDGNAQTSLLAAGLVGSLSAEDLEIFKKGQEWIEATKAEGRRVFAEGGEPSWPEVPDGVKELADRF